MSDSANTPPQPQGQLSEADERALDALLLEALAPSRQPRDFTSEILLQLDQQAVRPPVRDSASQPERAGGVVWAATAAIAALAASLLVMLLSGDPAMPPIDVAQQPSTAPPTTAPAGTERGGVASPAAGTELATNPRQSAEPAEASSKPPRRDPVLLSRDRQQAGANAPEQPTVTAPLPPAAADALAGQPLPNSPGGEASLADFNQQFAAYWQSVGVQPAPAIAYSQWQNRIAERFGWQPTAASEQEVIQQAFASSEASRALAERLVEQLLVGLKPSEERRQQLVDEATDVILSGERFDRWLSTWVADDAWVAQTASAGPHDPILVGDWFASRIVGADVGCAKCHDSPIDSRYAQDDFWGLAALFSPATAEPLFYELPDGRQRVATPSVPVRWFGPSGAAPSGSPAAPDALASRQELARRMVGSPRVARTLANHLWTIGFGMPLVSATSSPLAPPHDDSLERALTMLADRLESENFDIRAAAQWVIASEPMKRDVPEVLGDQRWQDADEAKLAAASLAQRSFAAAKVTVPHAGRSELLAMMQSRSGLIPATLTAPDSLLAQPLLRSPQPPGQGAAPVETRPPAAPPSNQPQIGQGELQAYWWSQWLADRETLRGGWLNSIDNTDQQLLHAFYAAGYRDVDHGQLERVETLLKATAASEQDRAETIAQIYWILQNSK